MKKSFRIILGLSAILVVILFTGFCIGKKGKINVKVVLLRMQVMYYAVNNPISVVADGIDPEDLIVSVRNGTIMKDSTNQSGYFVRTDKKGGYVIVDVKTKSGIGEKNLSTDSFRIQSLQDPVTYFSVKSRDGFLTREQIHHELGLFSRLENCNFDCRFMIESFSMTIVHEGVWKDTENKGPAFTKEMIDDLSRVEPEDKIIFHDIRVKGADGFYSPDVRKIPGLFITVK